ncbi:hypothetical protein EBR21_07850, partial [bacterium]|nr:hypothetical protein [bacterium]
MDNAARQSPKEMSVSQVTRYEKTERSRVRRSGRNTWFWRGVFVSTVANSLLAAADFSFEDRSVWSNPEDTIEIYASNSTDLTSKLMEVELSSDESLLASAVKPTADVAKRVATDVRTVAAVRSSKTEAASLKFESEKVQDSVAFLPENYGAVSKGGAISFPVDVTRSEVLRVSRTFQGMVLESLKDSAGQLSKQYLGSLSQAEPLTGEKLAELETTLIDEEVGNEEGYLVGQDVDAQVETAGLDPFKTYTVVNGRVHAVTPTQVVRSAEAPTVASTQAQERVTSAATRTSGSDNTLKAAANTVAVESAKGVSNGADVKVSANSNKPFELPADQVSKELAKIAPPTKDAALDSQSAESDRVKIRGKVNVPAGFARDRVVLRMAGSGFEVQTDAAGGFELRDVPKNSRFELLVWHLDGGLTRRFVPVVASGRERSLDVSLVKTTEIDQLANSFGTTQQMNQGGFCARLDHTSLPALTGGQVFVSVGQKSSKTHYFSANGLPSATQTELSEDGRFCVFNLEHSVADVRILLLNGVRRQVVVHVEPSTFEHDVVIDISESLYRKVSLLEPLDTQQVLELSARGVKPEFGDNRLRDWLFGNDVPVWTKVSRFLLQTDPTYASVRPRDEDVQYFPGGQEFVEVRLSPDQPGAPWSRVLLARDQLLSDSMLRQLETVKTRIYQDRAESISVPALDSDAWDDIVNQHIDVPQLQEQTIGGMYLSLDTMSLGYKPEDIVVSVRDTWSGKDVCKVVPLRSAKDIKTTRYL